MAILIKYFVKLYPGSDYEKIIFNDVNNSANS